MQVTINNNPKASTGHLLGKFDKSANSDINNTLVVVVVVIVKRAARASVMVVLTEVVASNVVMVGVGEHSNEASGISWPSMQVKFLEGW